MASLCRSAAVATVRSVAPRLKTALPKSLPSKSPSRTAVPLMSRPIYAAVATVESLMPLHSAIASARLRSSLALDSSYWSCLSQGKGEVNKGPQGSVEETREKSGVSFLMEFKIWQICITLVTKVGCFVQGLKKGK